MTWIKTVRMDEDDRVKSAMEAQRKLYPVEYATPVHPVNDGQMPGIVASHTLLPDVLFNAFSTFGALMSPDLPLKRHQHEMIATMVSDRKSTRLNSSHSSISYAVFCLKK